MWLLNTESKRLREFSGALPVNGVRSLPSAIPHYAILSHCWREGEVLFKDIQDLDRVRGMPGFQKIRHCCDAASRFGYQWAWVDTCCIDKSSSAELSEAVNSMFRWYEHADTCLVYLDDVDDGDPHRLDSSFRKSRWFTRGWTLQELLAPRQVVLFSKSWSFLGSRESLLTLLTTITGIPEDALSRRRNLDSFSIAQWMSWAAKRQTTRIEDQAYSLMGLFDIFMPIIYGEGISAFRRLQLEIIQRSDDQTIFAWSGGSTPYLWSSLSEFLPRDARNSDPFYDANTPFLWCSDNSPIFAPSPAEFGGSGNIIPLPMSAQTESLIKPLQSMKVYSWTHLGLHISMPLIPERPSAEHNETFLGMLSCWDSKERSIYGIMLTRDANQEGLYRCRNLFISNTSIKRVVSITQKDYDNILSKLVIHRDVYISNKSDPRTRLPKLLPTTSHKFKQAQFSVVLPNRSLKNLGEMGYSLARCASRHRQGPYPEDVEIRTSSGGDILIEFPSSPSCVHANLLFLDVDTNRAFSFFIDFCRHIFDVATLVDVAFHQPREFRTLSAQAVCDQSIDRHFLHCHERPPLLDKRPAGAENLRFSKSPGTTTVCKVFRDHELCLSTTSNVWEVHNDAEDKVCRSVWVELSLSKDVEGGSKVYVVRMAVSQEGVDLITQLR